MPTRRVLILDLNTDFADILRDGLEQAGKFVISIASTGQMAVEAMRGAKYDLAIIDAAVSDVSPAGLLERLRELDPYIHIVFMPLFGKELDDSLAALDIQGILYKPFFVKQLEEQVPFFLKRKVLTAPPTRVDQVRARAHEILLLLTEFSREVSAKIVALICQDELITYLGRAHDEGGETLVQLILDNLEVANQLATFLGEPDGYFELYSYVGKTVSLYALAFDEDLSLVTVPGNGIPPGVVRLQIKRVVEKMSALLHGDE